MPSQFQRQSPPASNKRWVLWIPIFQALHTEWAGPVRTQKKNRPLTGRYTLGDRAISTTQNRCGLLNALGGLTFYRLLNTEQKIFPRKGLTPVINLQVLGCFSRASAKGMNHSTRSLLRPFHLAVVDVAELSELLLSVIVSFWNWLSLVG